MRMKALTSEEGLYVQKNSPDINSRCGLIRIVTAGYDGDDSSSVFHAVNEDFKKDLVTPLFVIDLDKIFTVLRFAATSPLYNRNMMRTFCKKHPEAMIDDNVYGFRVDYDCYVFLLRLEPDKTDDNIICYCYKDWINKQIEAAGKGIRFVDAAYKVLFYVPDGGKIKITHYYGETDITTVRYIDAYHMELGNTVYHICEFADRIERAHAKVEPFMEVN